MRGSPPSVRAKPRSSAAPSPRGAERHGDCDSGPPPRRGVNGDPARLGEALRLARETGAALHVCHVTHNAMRNTELFLSEIREARAAGVDVSAEVLPCNAGSSLISSAVFGRDWRTIFAIDYSDVEWAATGMRFDEATWNEYREKHPEGQVVHHFLQDEWTRRALAEPGEPPRVRRRRDSQEYLRARLRVAWRRSMRGAPSILGSSVTVGAQAARLMLTAAIYSPSLLVCRPQRPFESPRRTSIARPCGSS